MLKKWSCRLLGSEFKRLGSRGLTGLGFRALEFRGACDTGFLGGCEDPQQGLRGSFMVVGFRVATFA